MTIRCKVPFLSSRLLFLCAISAMATGQLPEGPPRLYPVIQSHENIFWFDFWLRCCVEFSSKNCSLCFLIHAICDHGSLAKNTWGFYRLLCGGKQKLWAFKCPQEKKNIHAHTHTHSPIPHTHTNTPQFDIDPVWYTKMYHFTPELEYTFRVDTGVVL